MTSLRSRILRQTIQRVIGALDVRLSVQEQRTRMDRLARRGILVPRGVTVCTIQAGGVHAEWIEPVGTKTSRVILYLHGGAYCICSLDTHRGLAARLALACQARTLVIDYRLAPENPFPAALEDTLAAYRWLLEQGTPPDRIAVGGDSAGGGLTLAAALSLKAVRQPLPAAIFLISPWTDLTFSGDSIRTRKSVDPIFGHNGGPQYVPAYTGNHDPSDPLISPLFGDLHNFPPTLVHVGNDEILLDDSTRLVNRMAAAGSRAELEVWDGMWHVFPAFAPFVPEAQFAIDKIGAFVRREIPQSIKEQP
ncbi:MAG TPA: alpha/beta hydrolase [Anaerolineales bacterium]|nr:alpha/beta hydrolase [Anaerolineales bacterium]